MIYHNPRCGITQCLDLDPHAGIEPRIIEYLGVPPRRERLAELIPGGDPHVRDAIGHKEAAYREQGLDVVTLNDVELSDAMLGTPVLINRPFAEPPLRVRLCRPSEVVLGLLPGVDRPLRKQGRRGGDGRTGSARPWMTWTDDGGPLPWLLPPERVGGR